jgi:hypothetical protein
MWPLQISAGKFFLCRREKRALDLEIPGIVEGSSQMKSENKD